MLEGFRVGFSEVKSAGPAVFEVQQRVPAAEVGERGCPVFLSGRDQLGAAVGWLCFGSLCFGWQGRVRVSRWLRHGHAPPPCGGAAAARGRGW
jgi:hypothetical protein